MKTLKLFFYFMALTVAFSACGGDDDDSATTGSGSSGNGNTTPNVNANTGANQNAIVRAYCTNLEFPRLKEGGNNVVIVHIVDTYGLNYCVEWDADKHAQRWSCYQMHAANSVRNTSRYYSEDNQYPNDTFLDSQYHFTEDPYWGSGFNHGHICPSADRLCSFDANYQTFFMTNMQPQINAFNAGVWEKMEEQVRKWNSTNFRDTLFVVKGGTIDSEDNLGYVDSSGKYVDRKYIGSGKNRIPVPAYFYMAILCKKPKSQGGGYEAAAFWIQHKASYDDQLLKYLVSIDELEQLTGIDFFCNLPDDIENAVEKQIGSSFKVGLR